MLTRNISWRCVFWMNGLSIWHKSKIMKTKLNKNKRERKEKKVKSIIHNSDIQTIIFI